VFYYPLVPMFTRNGCLSLRLLLLSMVLVGCESGADHSPSFSFRKVYIENPRLTDCAAANALSNNLAESVSEEFAIHGFIVVSDKAKAQGFVRSSWQIQPPNGSETIMSLSISVFDANGRKVFSGSSGPAIPASFWTIARTNAEVVSILHRLPAAASASQ
jgi:hypothetical protein